jgi:hypothetical protein
MRSSRGEGGAGVVREKLEAERGNGNSSSCLTSLSYIFKSSPSSVYQTSLFGVGKI